MYMATKTTKKKTTEQTKKNCEKRAKSIHITQESGISFRF